MPHCLILLSLLAQGKSELGFCGCSICNQGYRELLAFIENLSGRNFFGTLFREWIAYRRYMIPESLFQSLGEFQYRFNNEREIQKLGYKTPMQIMGEKINAN